MLQAIHHNLDDDGMGLTVPSFEYIMDHNSYYRLIRDHIAYYTFDTPDASSGAGTVLCGEECEIINRDTLSVVVKKRPQMETGNLLECYVNLRKGNGHVPEIPQGVEQEGRHLGRQPPGLHAGGYHQAWEKAEYIIDSAPFKQEKFAPASHLPIVGPEHFEEHPVDAIVITAPGYTDEIAASIGSGSAKTWKFARCGSITWRRYRLCPKGYQAKPGGFPRTACEF